MGQQQLLLLVLSTIIVAFATVAGLEAFDEGQRQSAIDHITHRAIVIATDVQEYANRPPHMRVENTTGGSDLVIDFGELPHYETNGASGDGDYVDEYATYSLNGHNTLPGGYNPDACPNNSPINTVEAYSSQHDVSVCVSITGESSDELQAGLAQ